MDYLQHEKKGRKEFILRVFKKVKDQIPEDLWRKVPLREFTYEKKRNLEDKQGRLFPRHENLAFLLDEYIHLYKIQLPEDVTIEQAWSLI